MAHSSRSTSPDPITMPSSPLAPRSHNAVLPGRRRPRPTKPAAAAKTSPSKSFIMDTGPSADGGASPWRIKVTVEAEPKDGSSPSKQTTRTIKVPLKGADSSSPSKRASPSKKTKKKGDVIQSESEGDVGGTKKRKGTPVRRRSTRNKPVTDDDEEDDDDEIVPTQTSTPARKPAAARRRRKTPAKVPAQQTERSRRLTQAREELDVALQEAVGVDAPTIQAEHDTNSPNDVNMPVQPIETEIEVEAQPDNPAIEDEDENENQYEDGAPGDITIAHDEDFTMVSVETLESMKGNTSQLQLLENSRVDAGDTSGISVSYMPSSPPVEYSARREGDEASRGVGIRDGQEPNSSADLGATAEEAIVIEDDAAKPGAEREDSEIDQLEEEADDIWAEEASRSIEEEQQHQPQPQSNQPTHSPKLVDLFGSESLKPPRPKIPRTWRRSSGVNFSYVDSPEYGALRKTSGGASTDGGGGGGVLTPPSTDDENEDDKADYDDPQEPAEDEENGDFDIDLTQPDAAATQLQADTEPEVEGLSPGSSSDSSAPSPDGEASDTGLFWQTHLPNVYPSRRQRPRYVRQQRAMDLSELLDLDRSASPAKAKAAVEAEKERSNGSGSGSGLLSRNLVGRLQRQTNTASSSSPSEIRVAAASAIGEKVVSSPLRKSLLKGSKIGGASLPDVSGRQEAVASLRYSVKLDEQDSSISSQNERSEESAMQSFDSVASDQRQLLVEMGMASSAGRGEMVEEEGSGVDEESVYEVSPHLHEERVPVDMDGEEAEHADDDGEDNTERFLNETSRSYEEHLNLESPQKIKVKFNDSTTTATTTTTSAGSSLLAPRKEYPPLFTERPKKEFPPLFGAHQTSAPTTQKQAPTASPASISLVSKKTTSTEAESQPGIFTRLSTTFWSAVVRPSGPTEILPEPNYPEDLRRLIRSRYGVVSDQHPWTMTHMRTLHRLLNSCTSNKYDSIVPKSGPLPSALEKLVGKKLTSVTPDFQWTFTTQHAHVVDAFMQTLVPAHITSAIATGEMEFLGDAEAKKHRGLIAGRDGGMVVFTDVKEPQGEIGREWVVKAVGSCVMANIDTAERRQEEEERVRRVRWEREAWEKRNGVVYDDDDDEEEDGSFLPKVRQV